MAKHVEFPCYLGRFNPVHKRTLRHDPVRSKHVVRRKYSI